MHHNEHSSLSPELAVKIDRATGTSPESWLNMQTRLDLWKAEQKQHNVVPFPAISDTEDKIMED